MYTKVAKVRLKYISTHDESSNDASEDTAQHNVDEHAGLLLETLVFIRFAQGFRVGQQRRGHTGHRKPAVTAQASIGVRFTIL